MESVAEDGGAHEAIESTDTKDGATMNRRHFFGRMFGAGAASTVVIPTVVDAEPYAPSDRFLSGPWIFRWSGWRQHYAQDVLGGFWIGTHQPTGRSWYATIYGVIDELRHEAALLNTTSLSDYPFLTGLSDDVDREQARTATLNRLTTYLGTARPYEQPKAEW